jgi:hypothetical protein
LVASNAPGGAFIMPSGTTIALSRMIAKLWAKVGNMGKAAYRGMFEASDVSTALPGHFLISSSKFCATVRERLQKSIRVRSMGQVVGHDSQRLAKIWNLSRTIKYISVVLPLRKKGDRELVSFLESGRKALSHRLNRPLNFRVVNSRSRRAKPKV